MQERLEIALLKYNKKTWCKSAFLGFFIGLAVIVPGISGSTVAIIFKLYDQFLYAIGNLFKQFKKCFTFLLPIGLGIVVGLVAGFLTVKQLLALLPFAIICLFAGLMCGAFPAVKDEIKDAERTTKRTVAFIVGLLIPVAIGCVSAWLGAKGSEKQSDAFANVEWWQVVLGLAVGYVVGITQIVPGLSASAFLMAVGWFQSLMSSVSMTYWKANPAIFLLYAALGIGFLLGLFTFSKFLTHSFEKNRQGAYFMIVGLSLGSILSMFCNGDVIAVYQSWGVNGANLLDIFLGVALFAVGVIGSYRLVCYQRKKDAENETAQE